MAQLVVDTNSWVTEAEADNYMDSRFGSVEFWDDDTQKAAALITAYKRIVDSGRFAALPDTATQGMKDAQCEMALFLVAEGGDILRRKGLQAQGVVSAGIVKEVYDASMRSKSPFPPEVLELLEDYVGTAGNNFYMDDLTRDDTVDVN